MKRLLLILMVLSMLGGSIALANHEQGDGDFTVEMSTIEGDPTWGWEADYLRVLPFLLDSGWVDGDRSGYRCLYAFIEWRDRIVGRVTFTRMPFPEPHFEGDYARIIDEDMHEGQRFYDGSLAPPGSNELGDCPEPTEAYLPYFGPDQRPIVTYQTQRGPLEVRDYTTTVAGSSTKFQYLGHSAGPTGFGRETIMAHHTSDGAPWVAVYYDSMSSRVTMEAVLP